MWQMRSPSGPGAVETLLSLTYRFTARIYSAIGGSGVPAAANDAWRQASAATARRSASEQEGGGYLSSTLSREACVAGAGLTSEASSLAAACSPRAPFLTSRGILSVLSSRDKPAVGVF